MKHEFKDIKYKPLEITSEAFQHQKLLPAKYTCDGQKISPPLTIDHIPGEARSIVLIVDDPDAPRGMFVHWLVWNIPITHHIHENEIPGIEGLNDSGRHHYCPPCPPSGTHRYFFKLYALDAILDLPSDTNKSALEKVMQPHIMAFGEMIGLYQRK